MNKKLFIYTLAGILFVAIIGSLLHFVYEWSGENFTVGLFAPVNESTWEHMKLFFFPMLIYSIFLILLLHKDYPCLATGTLYGILSGTFLIPVLFYTYTGILGFHTLFLDIAVFLISVLCAFFIFYKNTLHCHFQVSWLLFFLVSGILLLLFFLFSYMPPNIGLFISP